MPNTFKKLGTGGLYIGEPIVRMPIDDEYIEALERVGASRGFVKACQESQQTFFKHSIWYNLLSFIL